MDVLFSSVYCQGELLDSVLLSNIYSKSTEFVDMQMKRNDSFLLSDFYRLKTMYEFENSIPLFLLQKFLRTNFKHVQLENWEPPDFKYYQPIFEYLKDNSYKLVFNFNKINFKYYV
jgi:hypothetical protein